MLRSIRAIVGLAALFVCVQALPANAGIPIPCMGDRLVKVVEIPAANQPRDFTVELGYKFPGCFYSGEWIGYVNSEKYIKLDSVKTKAILEMAGLKELPSVPSRLEYLGQGFMIELFYAAIVALAFAEQFFSERRRRRVGNVSWIGLDEAEQMETIRKPERDK